MNYTFSTANMAARFVRNARSRGYAVRRLGATVEISVIDAQVRLLVQRYAGVTNGQVTTTTTR